MYQLVTRHPELDEHFYTGGFSTQLSNATPFGKILIDQTIKETINKYTQMAGGTKIFSLKASTVAKYYITSEYRSSCVRMMRQMAEMQHKGLSHLDLRS